MKRLYIGLSHSIHDPALALVDQAGDVLFAEATERSLQMKRAWNSPPDLLHDVPRLLAEYGGRDTEHVICTSWSTSMFAITAGHYLAGPLRPANRRRPSGSGSDLLQQRIAWLLDGLLANSINTGLNVRYHLREMFGVRRTRVHRFHHHLTHAACASYLSPFDEATTVVVDGFGELGSLGVYHYKDGRLAQIKRSRAATSLGFYYAALTEWCGFDWLKGEEWKVMGLAPYGTHNPDLRRHLERLVSVKGCDLVAPSSRVFDESMAALEQHRLPPGRSARDAADFAFTGQQVYCDHMTTLLGNIHALGISDNLTLSGGCALNSAYNGQILDRLPYRALYVPSAPGDDGNAVGAALLGWHRDHPTTPRPPRRQTPYLGTRLKSDAVERLARDGGFARVRQLRGALYDEAARMLADGRLLGWVQGRAEFGPRALGNRSILGDPRSPGMKDLINSRVKFREGFRPFAPSILHEHGPEWFEHYQESPYMERTLRWRAEVADRVPAVVHADRTGRLQSVTLEGNPEFHALISAFYHLTGVPILLNTSFNVMGKPIIHTVEDAASVFVTSGLDGLVIGEYLFEKRGPV